MRGLSGYCCTWLSSGNAETHTSTRLLQAMNEAGTHIALGCCGTSLSLWQLDTRAKVWQAKGPKRNRIGLVDKPWDTAVAFLPGSQGQRLIAGTTFGKLRTFVTSQKRATREVVSEESRVTALAPTADGEQCTGHHRCLQAAVHCTRLQAGQGASASTCRCCGAASAQGAMEQTPKLSKAFGT